MLKVKNLNVSYGAIHAIHDVSLEVNEGEIVSLIGANGAGKTTTLSTITGLKKAASGEVTLDGQNLLAMQAPKIVGLGLAHVPEGRRIFAEMTVAENLEMGAYTRRERAEVQQSIEDVYGRFPRLKERYRQVAGTLSGGEQQMLAIGRALMSRPKILLMDEPSMGLSPLLVKEIFAIIGGGQRLGGDGAACRAERQDGPFDRQPRLCAGDRAGGHGGRRQGADGQQRDQEGLSGGVEQKTKRGTPS